MKGIKHIIICSCLFILFIPVSAAKTYRLNWLEMKVVVPSNWELYTYDQLVALKEDINDESIIKNIDRLIEICHMLEANIGIFPKTDDFITTGIFLKSKKYGKQSFNNYKAVQSYTITMSDRYYIKRIGQTGYTHITNNNELFIKDDYTYVIIDYEYYADEVKEYKATGYHTYINGIIYDLYYFYPEAKPEVKLTKLELETIISNFTYGVEPLLEEQDPSVVDQPARERDLLERNQETSDLLNVNKEEKKTKSKYVNFTIIGGLIVVIRIGFNVIKAYRLKT